MQATKDWDEVVANIIGDHIGMQVQPVEMGRWWCFDEHSIEYTWVHYWENLTDAEVRDHWGKYLIYGSAVSIEDMAQPLGLLVFAGFIDSLKYIKSSQMLGRPDWVMCVYCDDGDGVKVGVM